MGLFCYGNFKLHSGSETFFKINCDALTDEDLDTLVALIMEKVTWFAKVEGVPTGGLRLAEKLAKYAKGEYAETRVMGRADGKIYNTPLLIVDDVLTSGASMEEQRAGRKAQGVVIFARGKCPDWVKPIFQMEVD